MNCDERVEQEHTLARQFQSAREEKINLFIFIVILLHVSLLSLCSMIILLLAFFTMQTQLFCVLHKILSPKSQNLVNNLVSSHSGCHSKTRLVSSKSFEQLKNIDSSEYFHWERFPTVEMHSGWWELQHIHFGESARLLRSLKSCVLDSHPTVVLARRGIIVWNINNIRDSCSNSFKLAPFTFKLDIRWGGRKSSRSTEIPKDILNPRSELKKIVVNLNFKLLFLPDSKAELSWYSHPLWFHRASGLPLHSFLAEPQKVVFFSHIHKSWRILLTIYVELLCVSREPWKIGY